MALPRRKPKPEQPGLPEVESVRLVHVSLEDLEGGERTLLELMRGNYQLATQVNVDGGALFVFFRLEVPGTDA